MELYAETICRVVVGVLVLRVSTDVIEDFIVGILKLVMHIDQRHNDIGRCVIFDFSCFDE